jgi:single-strand DNA-binding protein
MNNSITLVGHVGQAPTSVSFDDGKKVAKFSLAVKEFSSNTDEEKTLWIDVDAWNGLGDRVLATITKGREVVIIGRLALSQYDKEINGVSVPMTKPLVKLTSFHLCGKKPIEEGTTTTPKAKKPRLAAVSA